MQTRKHSTYESAIKTAIGVGYAIPINYVLIHQVTWSDPWLQSVVITVIFTVLSFTLNLALRRIFNAITVRHWIRETQEYPSNSGDDILDVYRDYNEKMLGKK